MVCNEPALFSGFVFVVTFSSINWKAFSNLVLRLGIACFIVLSCKRKLSSCQRVSNYVLL